MNFPRGPLVLTFGGLPQIRNCHILIARHILIVFLSHLPTLMKARPDLSVLAVLLLSGMRMTGSSRELWNSWWVEHAAKQCLWDEGVQRTVACMLAGLTLMPRSRVPVCGVLVWHGGWHGVWPVRSAARGSTQMASELP
jgi:hypothetical protein